MADKHLIESWKRTTRHLLAAMDELPAEIPHMDDGWSLARCQEWLDHNELELAFDELEGIGDEMGCSRRFWQELLAAAENMGLDDHSSRCRKRLTNES